MSKNWTIFWIDVVADLLGIICDFNYLGRLEASVMIAYTDF